MKINLILIACLFLVSCAPSKMISRKEIGKITKVTIISPGFLDPPRTQVETEKLSVVLEWTPTIEIGKQATIVYYDNNTCSFFWEGSPRAYSCY